MYLKRPLSACYAEAKTATSAVLKWVMRRVVNNPVVRVIMFFVVEYILDRLCRTLLGKIWDGMHLGGDALTDETLGQGCFLAAVLITNSIMYLCFRESILTIWRGPTKNIFLGVTGGIAVGLLTIVTQVDLLEHFHFLILTTSTETAFPFNRVGLNILLVSVGEETMYRGYLFQASEKYGGTSAAVFISMTLFSLPHLGNIAGPSSPELIVRTIFVTASGGLLYSSCLVLTRRLWMPIALHFSLDILQDVVYGDNSFNIFPFFNVRYIAQAVDWTSGLLFLFVGIVLLLLAVRRGNWIKCQLLHSLRAQFINPNKTQTLG